MARNAQLNRTMAAIEALEVVLRRIGITPWEELHWFVEMAQKDPKKMTEGEQLSLREELAALDLFLRIGGVRASSPAVSLPDWNLVRTFQESVLEHLTSWVDHGRLNLGPFELRLELKRASDDIVDRMQAVKRRMPGQPSFGHIARYSFPGPDQRWQFTLSELLRDHASAVQRCPHCNRIFLKFRKNARYCSRACHSVAYMRRRRANPKEEQGSRKRKGLTRFSKNRRARHGKKRR